MLFWGLIIFSVTSVVNQKEEIYKKARYKGAIEETDIRLSRYPNYMFSLLNGIAIYVRHLSFSKRI